jgi:glutamate/tyrosine decarboxylase-like PLP-dependent enzyme
MISDDIELSREMYRRAAEHAELEALTQSLSITTFRYVPPDFDASEEYLNQLNTELLARLQRGGRVFLSNAVLGTRFALRACIVNFRTTIEDVGVLIEEAVKGGRVIHRELVRSKAGFENG